MLPLQKKHVSVMFKNQRGFVLPFTMLISVLIVFVTTSALALLARQQYFSKLYKQNQVAYYAADDSVACTILIDDTYTGGDGLGIFPVSSTTPIEYIDSVVTYVKQGNPSSPATKDQITCGQSPIFGPSGSPSFDPQFSVAPVDYAYYFINPQTGLQEIEYGQTSSYNMRMDLGLDPNDTNGVARLYRCAKVTVNKTQSFRQIIAQGYSSCSKGSGAVERAVVNTTVTQ